MIAQKERTAPQHTRSFCRCFTRQNPSPVLRRRYFSFLGTCRGEAPPFCCARPSRCLKAPLGLSLLRYAAQTRTCRDLAPPSCCARPFCRLKAPLGLSLLRSASQTRTFENTSLSAACKKTQGKLWQKERGPDGADPLDRIMRCSKNSAAFIAVFKNSAEQNGIFTICSLRILLRWENRIRQKDKVSAGKIRTRQ